MFSHLNILHRTQIHQCCLLPYFNPTLPFVLNVGGTSLKYQEVFLNRLMASISHAQPEVRQAAAYGCGVMGQCGGPNYAQVRHFCVLMRAYLFLYNFSKIF